MNFIRDNLAPLMFGGMVLFMLIGYPAAFSLAATGLFFGFLGIEFGLIRWPVKLILPVGFALMALQGVSEIIKRIAALEHVVDLRFDYEKPLQ